MAEYISFQPSDFYSTKIYTGTGASQNITGVGFDPNLVWIKIRSTTNNPVVFDTVRTATKALYTDITAAEATEASGLTAFITDGWTGGGSNITNGGSGKTYVCWNWKAGTTTVPSGGSITPSAVSLNTTSGISIISYTGTGDTSNTIAHGLGAVPKMMIFKNRDATMDWVVYHEALGNTDYMVLNTTGAAAASTSRWNDTSPTSTLFTIGNTDKLNSSGVDYIGYVFADVKGYSKMGSYTGNGNADGTFVYTGFRPSFVMVKKTAGESWAIIDDKRLGYNVANYQLFANQTSGDTTEIRADIVSNGFKVRTSNGEYNTSGSTYIYMAFAEFPIVSSNDVPVVAR